jgi:hypothetical protein
MDFSQWFVATVEGESDVHILIKAVDKAEALAYHFFHRDDQSLPIMTWQEYCEQHFVVDAERELYRQVGFGIEQKPYGTMVIIG